MKKSLLVFSALLLMLPVARAADFTENCYDIYDPLTDSYIFECSYEPVQHYFETSTTYDMAGLLNIYFDGVVQVPDQPITGLLTITSWYDDWYGDSGEYTNITLGSSMLFESYSWTGGTTNSLSYIEESMFDAVDGQLMTIDSPTQWDVSLFYSSIAAATMDGDGNGIPGIEITDTFWPADTVIDIQLQAVPVPAAVWLFASGLFGLLGIAFKRKR